VKIVLPSRPSTHLRLAIISLLVILGLTFTAFGQECNHRLEGAVYDLATQEPIPFATVRVKNTSVGTVTDQNGHFALKNLCKLELDLLVSHVGYKTASHHHDAHHQNPAIYLAPDDLILESIVVEGETSKKELISGTISKLSSEDLAEIQSETLGDVVSQVPGVNTLTTGQNIVKPVIHGLHSNRVLIINNGLRHEFQNWGAEHAPEIDPSLAEEITIVKGAASVRYGPEALGGVVLIDPATIRLNSHLHGEVRLTGKSNGRSGEGTVKLQKGFKNFGVMGETSWLRQGDLHTADHNLTNTGKFEKSYSAGVRFHPLEQVDINAYFSHFDQELGILRGAVNGNLEDLVQALNADVPNDTQPFSYDITTPKQEVIHDLVKVQADYNGIRQSLSLKYGFQDNNRREFDVRRGNNNEIPNINLELKTHSLDLDWDHPELWGFSGKLGFQWAEQDNKNIPGTNTIPFIPNFNSKRWGVYWIESLELGKNEFEAGLRFDRMTAAIAGRDRQNEVFTNDLEYNNATFMLGLKRRLSTSETLFTNFGTAWRPPNISELYRFGRHLTFIEFGLWRHQITENGQISSDEILTQEERPVPSEVSYKWTTTYELKKDNLSMNITGYINYIQDFIFTTPGGVTQTVRGTAPFFLFDQGDALFWGLDVSGRYRHSEKFQSTIRSSYLWSKQINPEDNFVGQPPPQINYALSFEPKIPFFSKSSFKVFLEYTFRQFQTPRVIPVEELLDENTSDLNLFRENFDIQEAPDGYFLTHFSWQSTWQQFEFNFKVKNLFDIAYRNYTNRIRYFADEPGRNFIFSIAYKL